MVVAATLGTAAVVAVSGLIGFVGFVVPHTVRLLLGTSYRVIVPLSLVLGAAFLILADLAARTVVAPGELPIGVVTAFIGAPFFALVLWSGHGGESEPGVGCRRGACRLQGPRGAPRGGSRGDGGGVGGGDRAHGSGKSTLLRVIAGTLESMGEVSVDGIALGGLPRRPRWPGWWRWSLRSL